MSERNTEVELRYKVYNPELTKRNLAALGIKQLGKDHLIDQWFLPTGISSLAGQKEWFDGQKGIAWRIRRTAQPDGGFLVETTSKQHTEANDHNTFAEGDAGIDNYEAALAFMSKKGYRCWITIDKTRYSFDSGRPDIEVVMDEIEGLADKIGIGAALELEFKGSVSRGQALAELELFAQSLSLKPEDRFAQSLTAESMIVLADFGSK